MVATIAQVRILTGDISSPYLFDDIAVQDELDAAAEYIGISTTTALGIRAHKLQAGIFIVSNNLGKIKNRAASRIKEGDASIDYVDLQKQAEIWKDELKNILARLQDIPFAFDYDQF